MQNPSAFNQKKSEKLCKSANKIIKQRKRVSNKNTREDMESGDTL